MYLADQMLFGNVYIYATSTSPSLSIVSDVYSVIKKYAEIF
jgi:hypothetical protein